MIAVVQRVERAKVTVEGKTVGEIGQGLAVLAAVEAGDTEVELAWMAGKLASLRVFRSEDGVKHFDRDVMQVGGAVLLVSNFTVAAETAKGRRPSLSGAAPPDEARALFARFVELVKAQGVAVAMGEFGANMVVELANDGPVTFVVKSERRSDAPPAAT